MGNTPNPLNQKNLTRATVIASGMAAGGIVLFLVLYFAMSSAGVDALARVVVALCVPPAIMAVVIGGYFLVKRSSTQR
jgi:hypothetical protein